MEKVSCFEIELTPFNSSEFWGNFEHFDLTKVTDQMEEIFISVWDDIKGQVRARRKDDNEEAASSEEEPDTEKRDPELVKVSLQKRELSPEKGKQLKKPEKN